MKSVFIVQHVHEKDEKNEDVKFIGSFSSKDQAEKVVSHLKTLPGFTLSPNTFTIDEYEIDKIYWAEGFEPT
jgi:hypothetical protein